MKEVFNRMDDFKGLSYRKSQILKVDVPVGSQRPIIEGYYFITAKFNQKTKYGMTDVYEYVPYWVDLCDRYTVRTENYVVQITEN